MQEEDETEDKVMREVERQLILYFFLCLNKTLIRLSKEEHESYVAALNKEDAELEKV